MNVSQLVQYVKDLVAQPSSSNPYWSDAQILRFLNASLRHLTQKKIEMDPDGLMEPKTFAELDMNTSEALGQLRAYRLPDYVLEVRKVERLYVDYSDVVAPSDVNEYQNVGLPSYLSGLDASGRWFWGGDRRLTTSSPASPSELRLWFVHRPADMVRFEATGGTTTTVTASVSALGAQGLGDLVARPEHYVGSYLECESAGGADPEGERRRITAFARSAYPSVTFTLDAALSAAPGAGDVFGVTPTLDPMYHELLCYEAALRCLDNEGNVTHKQSLQQTAAHLYAQFIASADYRQSQAPRYGQHIPRGDT